MTHFDLDVKGSLWLLSGQGQKLQAGHEASGAFRARSVWLGQASGCDGRTLYCMEGGGLTWGPVWV